VADCVVEVELVSVAVVAVVAVVSVFVDAAWIADAASWPISLASSVDA